MMAARPVVLDPAAGISSGTAAIRPSAATTEKAPEAEADGASRRQ
jgi:hypothetical protein